MPLNSSPRPTATQDAWVYAATLAASSHNSQPWLFGVANDAVTIYPDLRRRCPMVDPDDHHLCVSLGCATENLVSAARADGMEGDVEVHTTKNAVEEIRVRWTGAQPSDQERASAIARRQCARAEYDTRTVGADVLARLERAATGSGVSPVLITDAPRKAAIADWVAQGNTVQLADPRWREELVSWLRFNEREARKFGDGLWSRATGNPDVPRALGRLGLPLFLNARVQNGKDVPWTLGSAGLLVFVADKADAEHWIEVGRCYERFALEATTLGLCNSFINQPVEVPSLRRELATWLGLGERVPDLVVRFGYGPEMPRSPRRPLADVLRPADANPPPATPHA